MLLAIEAHDPLTMNETLFVWVNRRRRDFEPGVVMGALASGHAIAADELDVALSDLQRDGHVRVVELRDGSGLDGGVYH